MGRFIVLLFAEGFGDVGWTRSFSPSFAQAGPLVHGKHREVAMGSRYDRSSTSLVVV